MNFRAKTISRVGFALFLLTCLSACGGSDSDDPKERDNFECEMACVEENSETIVDCHITTRACLSACGGVEDGDCRSACASEESECKRELTRCGVTCPCASEAFMCAAECIQDDTCDVEECSAEYMQCGASGLPYGCVVDCDDVRFACVTDCDDSSSDLDELTECRGVCDAAYDPCQSACENMERVE